jgi:hypothetical protein
MQLQQNLSLTGRGRGEGLIQALPCKHDEAGTQNPIPLMVPLIALHKRVYHIKTDSFGLRQAFVELFACIGFCRHAHLAINYRSPCSPEAEMIQRQNLT